MKILFAAPENAWGGFLGKLRAETPHHEFNASGRFAVDTLSGYDILIPTMCLITKDILAEADNLRLIQQCGAGLEGVDLQAAGEKGIWVANVPTDISGNADSVAELGIYLMIGLSRNCKGMARSFAERQMGVPPGRSLKGKTAGLIGLGGIGKALIKRLKAFDMNIVGIKRYGQEDARRELDLDWVGSPGEIKELLQRSDYVILCLPLTSESRHMIGRDSFRHMKKDAFLINLSRGSLIDYNALDEALATGRLAGAGLDVFWEEPPDPGDKIFRHNVLATPHIAGSTDISMRGIVKVVAENIRRLETNRKPLYVKN